MPTITGEFLDELVDFAPSDAVRERGFAIQQREGTVALFNMLAANRCAYLADEVGMGKTYVALAVMSLLRYFQPQARIVVIAPRENIQRKWVKELHNFVRLNWRPVGNRVKALQGGPVWEPVICGSLLDFAEEALNDQDRDFFLRMTSFSLALSDAERQKRLRRRLCDLAKWIRPGQVRAGHPERFRDDFAMALNGAVPTADLVIVDEAHNLKHGFGPDVSTRNRVMGLAFGHPQADADPFPAYRTRARRLLLLSATPFEDDYAAIGRQLDVFGFGDALLAGPRGASPMSVRTLLERDAGDENKREVVRRLLVRRVAGLNIAGSLHTKNMYRREWRQGGYAAHDEPIRIEDPRQRLVVALMQKKVAEVLQSERFSNSFQIGMLSSFESFLQSVETVRRRRQSVATDEEEEEDGIREFDDSEQNRRASEAERQGIDSASVARIAQSYRERFGRTLPHPKLDATAAAHAGVFRSGEKVLIFVRRVRTVDELAAKLDEAFDGWVHERMLQALQSLEDEVRDLFTRYARERAVRPGEVGATVDPSEQAAPDLEAEEHLELREHLVEEDEGGADSFFAWFFRGDGPRGVLSGAAFQKNRLSSPASRYVTLLDDDYVGALLGVRDADVLAALRERAGTAGDALDARLRARAFAYFSERSRQKEGYPRLYVWEGYQVAALELLEAAGGALGERARIVRSERFPEVPLATSPPPPGFPGPEVGLGITTVCTVLRERPDLLARLWPQEPSQDFREAFRRSEQRRELMSAMCRLGASYIDLYLLAIRRLGSFSLRGQSEPGEADAGLARDFVDLLERQRAVPGFHAFHELSQAAEAFDQIIAVNFPEAPSVSVPELARLYGATLQKQVPVGRMAGSVNKRLVRQFRMPGFPLALITTDVLQEGEDLHTFCKHIVHYGIAWTPSSMEQRTGRIDRIGGLVQRRLDGTGTTPRADDLIQVFYPHLRDTVEVLQVRRVLARLDRFLRLIHRTGAEARADDSAIDAARALLEPEEVIEPPEGPLESAFPVDPGWLAGTRGAGDVERIDWEQCFAHLDRLWQGLTERHAIDAAPIDQQRVRRGTARIVHDALLPRGDESGAAQAFVLELRSQVTGEATLLRCESEIGLVDLKDDSVVDTLLDLERRLAPVKLCSQPRVQKDADLLLVRRDILFDLDATQVEDVVLAVESTVRPAASIHAALKHAGLLGSRAP